MEAYDVRVETPRLAQAETRRVIGFGHYTQVLPGIAQVSSICMEVTPRTGSGTKGSLIVCWGKEGSISEDQNRFSALLKPGEPFRFEVPVQWNSGKPSTRQEPKDNFRILLLSKDGHVRQVELGVLTRGKEFFLTMQLQWQGWITKSAGFIASGAQFNYPGHPEYQNLWPGVVPWLLKNYAYLYNAQDNRPQTPLWIPRPTPPERAGHERGVVLYYSPIAGTGRVLSAQGVAKVLRKEALDEKDVWFLHFSKITGVQHPIGVSPLTWVYAKVGEKRVPTDQHCPLTECTPA